MTNLSELEISRVVRSRSGTETAHAGSDTGLATSPKFSEAASRMTEGFDAVQVALAPVLACGSPADAAAQLRLCAAFGEASKEMRLKMRLKARNPTLLGMPTPADVLGNRG